MANDLAINEGTGAKKIATVEVSLNRHAQILVPKAENGTDPAPVTAHVTGSDLNPPTRLTDSIAVALQVDRLMNDLTALVPKYAVIAASASGDNALVALVASKKIRVLAYNFMGSAAVNAKFRSGTTDITGLKYIADAGGGICAPFNPVGWFETAAGAALNLNLSGAVAVGGELVYVEV